MGFVVTDRVSKICGIRQVEQGILRPSEAVQNLKMGQFEIGLLYPIISLESFNNGFSST